jgi:Zn-dependent protease
MKTFSTQEIKDMGIAVVILTLMFNFAFFHSFDLFKLLLSLLIVITSFVFHELGHKFMGQRYGCEAYFKLWPQGLLLSLISVIISIRIPFIFAAPGATVIQPKKHARWAFAETRLTIYELGMISFIGPFINLIISIIFLPFRFFSYISFINAYIAFFNLLPIPPLDGSKVIIWKNWLWLIMIVLSGTIVFYTMSSGLI